MGPLERRGIEPPSTHCERVVLPLNDLPGSWDEREPLYPLSISAASRSGRKLFGRGHLRWPGAERIPKIKGMAKEEDQVSRLLKRSKLRRTPVRAGVLEILAKSGRPLGAMEILEKLPPHTDAVTVYRTLNTFTRKHVLHRVRGEDRVWRYALGDPLDSAGGGAHQHPHFVCESCGKVECLKQAEIPAGFVRSLGVQTGYQIRFPEVVLHGICPRCG